MSQQQAGETKGHGPKTYKIENWNRDRENDRSRKYKNPRWHISSNDLNDPATIEILNIPNGAAIIGILELLCRIAGQQNPPREGWLTHDGAACGRPYTIRQVASVIRRPEAEVTEAIAVLVEHGLITEHDPAHDILAQRRQAMLSAGINPDQKMTSGRTYSETAASCPMNEGGERHFQQLLVCWKSGSREQAKETV